MAANYLHGVEPIEVEKGKRPVRTVKSAVIALIGTCLSANAAFFTAYGTRERKRTEAD